ncbi:MAG: fibronectin type III domain-containing protein [Actinomycetia bacterium]|nr:fibronectin type III domain-containing protein [Actinomycetes bacterium]
MRRLMKKALISLAMALAAAAAIAPSAAYAATAAPAPAPPAALYAGRVDSDTLKLTWKAAEGIDGYVVLRYDAAKKSYRKAAVVGKRATSWTDKATLANKTYSYKMRSYKAAGGKRTYSALTYAVSSKTHSPVAKKTNVQRVTAPKALTLGIRQAVPLRAKILHGSS